MAFSEARDDQCALDAAEHIVNDNASQWNGWRQAVWAWLDENLLDEVSTERMAHRGKQHPASRRPTPPPNPSTQAPAWLKWRIMDWLSALFLLCLAKRFQKAPRVKRVLEWLLEY